MAPTIMTENPLYSGFAATKQEQADPTGNIEQNPFVVDSDNMAATIIVYGILALCFGFLIGLVLVDMRRKYRTGDLQETVRNLGYLCLLLLKAPFMLFSRKNMSAVWIWFTDLFRSAENKRGSKKAAPISLDRQFDHNAIILRLGAKPDVSGTETGTTTSDSDNKGVLVTGGEGSGDMSTSTSPPDMAPLVRQNVTMPH
ncbi:hypothetical protein BKA56DRAFT_198441 [Ilyonectria sp. MPI-CAGE-AT-0026]|nr:hypothetical protein BKA56DRAFT_198441 [Ilyonectria sp. MPI-CAGE-AT-0026]